MNKALRYIVQIKAISAEWDGPRHVHVQIWLIHGLQMMLKYLICLHELCCAAAIVH